MKKYAKILEEETKKVSVALGEKHPSDYQEMYVEQAYNGSWYVTGYAPQPSVEYQNEQIRAARQARYVVESDPLRLDYDEALARGEETAEQLKQDWLASKDKIREELPYVMLQEVTNDNRRT